MRPIHDDSRCRRRRELRELRGDQHRARLRAFVHRRITSVRQKAEVRVRRAVERRHGAHFGFAVSRDLSSDKLRDVRSGESANTLTACGPATLLRLRHRVYGFGRVTPAGAGRGPAGVLAALSVFGAPGAEAVTGTGLSREITFSVMSRLRSA